MNMIRISEDKDVFWCLSIISSNISDDISIVVDCCEVGNDENSNTLSMHVNDSIILNPSSSSRKECRFFDSVDVDAMSEEIVLKKGYVFHGKIELKKATYIFALEEQVYSASVYPISSVDQLTSTSLNGDAILPPNSKRPTGRPKKEQVQTMWLKGP
ncbi:unnamed protein product [Citrullus colocynthis]|uniref:Uncharacterized protein n=1 Tax=Citrullus colocynthis TaxID=252529 RepID=A0ABP0YH14_9ROSI